MESFTISQQASAVLLGHSDTSSPWTRRALSTSPTQSAPAKPGTHTRQTCLICPSSFISTMHTAESGSILKPYSSPLSVTRKVKASMSEKAVRDNVLAALSLAALILLGAIVLNDLFAAWHA
ncbi:hypothetical protein PBI_TOURACH_43 [Mycobacterium phage Tourach]|uniref:Uncharacterized protein n=1 Tax=Mycobacterium phage Tourach TaxID=2599882 RepID=A0A5J6TU35_9CAUD|nr:hypothetical protein J4T98_gp043 [Mycobacterium phage Tourach]QFG14281.1 hypothetical protein PBI_TOURACH_43 [Mycobacterium phage Tourach]